MTQPNRYEVAAQALLDETGVSVKKYRTSSSGRAFFVGNQIECPKPRGPISFAILAHEVAHKLEFRRRGYKKTPRWESETRAWEYALGQLERFDLPGHDRVFRFALPRVQRSFYRAVRRGADPDLIEETFPVWFNTDPRSLA